MREVLLVAEKDTITGGIKSGPRLRYENPPDGYKYRLYLDPYSQSGLVRYRSMDFFTGVYMLLKAVFLRTRVLYTGEDIVHSFFWTFYRYRRPWIHENDQSPFQLLYNYFKLPMGFALKISSMVAGIINTASAVITWSQYAMKGFINDGVDRRLLRVVRLPVRAPGRVKEPHDGFNFLFIGREQIRKGGDLAIQVVERLVEDGARDVRLIYIGKGRVPRKPWIEHYESVPGRELREKVYPRADVLLYPSRAEAYGMAALEALSYGIPVLTLDTGPLGEIVVDGKTGFVCRRLECLVDAAKRLYGSPTLLEEMSKAAVNYVRENHSPDVIRRQIQEIYDRVS